MEYKPLNKPSTLMRTVKRAALAFTTFAVLAGGCSNQNSYNKLPNTPPSSQKMVDAKPNLRIIDGYHVMVITRDNKAVAYDLSKEMAIQKVGSLEGATWDSMDDKDGIRIYTIYPKNSNSTLAIILAPPKEEKNTVKTKNTQL